MRYEARVTAYDIMDLVTVQARIWDSHESQVGDERDYVWVTATVPGQGLSEPRQWLRAALDTLLREL